MRTFHTLFTGKRSGDAPGQRRRPWNLKRQQARPPDLLHRWYRVEVRPEQLALDRDEMRRLGYAVIDMLVEHFDTLAGAGARGEAPRLPLETLLAEGPPEQGTAPDELLPYLRDSVFGATLRLDHPRFFAFVPSPGNFVSAMADALASGFNPFLGTWFGGAGPSAIEVVTVDWLRSLCGLPDTARGLFVSGGSVANLTALAVARERRVGYRLRDAAVYFSDQTHSSVERALRILGFAPAQMRRIPAGEDFRLPLDALAQEVARDRSFGRIPFCVVANAGTTSTGAVDPLRELAAFCREEDLWLHVDGAYGAAAVLAEEGRRALDGIEQADSLSLDPHKWLFQPLEIGCVLVREGELLRDTFLITPEYLRDVHGSEREANFCDQGIQLSRGFRALKLWLSLKVFGVAAFRAAISRGFALAEAAERRLRSNPAWEIVSPAQLAIVAFRYAPPGLTAEQQEAVNQRLVRDMLADGFAVLSSTTLRGRTALRLCAINPRTTDADIAETIARLEHAAAK